MLQKGVIIIPLLLIVVLVLGVGVYFLVFNKQAVVPGNSSVQSQVTDLAPSLPENQKAKVVIRNPDSSITTIVIPLSQVDDYLKHLPPGQKLVSKTP